MHSNNARKNLFLVRMQKSENFHVDYVCCYSRIQELHILISKEIGWKDFQTDGQILIVGKPAPHIPNFLLCLYKYDLSDLLVNCCVSVITQ